jgi:hypothetical protein
MKENLRWFVSDHLERERMKENLRWFVSDHLEREDERKFEMDEGIPVPFFHNG